MRKFIFLAALVAIAFYVAWPSWSAYQIYQGLQTSDKALLERKIDWPGVKTSLKPAVDVEIGKALDRSAQEGAMGQILSGPLRAEIQPKLSEAALNTLVTPDNLIKLVAEGGSLKGVLDSVVKAGLPGGGGAGGGMEIGGIKVPSGLGGLIGKALGQAPAAPAAEKPVATASQPSKAPAYGISNIKRFAFTGLTGFEIGVAKDAAAATPDVVARMGFTGTDWKLVGLVPRVP